MSDTHLGFSAYGKVNERGLNQREEDVFDAFRQVVDAALELRPEAVLHSGDLFDSVRPTNRAVSFAVEQILRLSRRGIPFVVIAGNHETPKLRETGSVFRFLEFFQNVHPVYRGAYERVPLPGLTVHAVPQCATPEALRQELEFASPRGEGHHVLMAHVGVLGMEEFRNGEFNEQVVPSGLLKADFRYVALGHFHRHVQVTDNAWYAGSTERMSFSEAGDDKGFSMVDLESCRVEFFPLKSRPMLDLPAIDCARLPESAVPGEIVRAIEGSRPQGKIVRLRVKAIPRHVYAALDFHQIRRAAADALHFHAKFDVVDADGALAGEERAIGPLGEEFDRFMAGTPLTGLDRARIHAMAKGFLQEAGA